MARFPVLTIVRWGLGIATALAFLLLGIRVLSDEPRIAALLLAFAMLRGGLVGRQIWTEWTETQTEPAPAAFDGPRDQPGTDA